MAKHILDGAYTATITIDDENQWVLAKAGSVVTNNDWNSSIDTSTFLETMRLTIKGLVNSATLAIDAGDFTVAHIAIGATGAVSGYNGIRCDGSDGTLVNRGRIDASNTAVIVSHFGSDDFTFENYGVISGGSGIDSGSPGVYHNYKGAVIQGNAPVSIEFDNEAGSDYASFYNDGLIRKTGDDDTPAFAGGAEPDYLENNGRIKGSVVLGDGRDVYSGAGTLVGTLDGGYGNDSLSLKNGRIGSKDAPFGKVVDGGSGNDRIDARGATIVNGYITGADGNDHIDVRDAHMRGTRLVYGGSGNDTLVVSSGDIHLWEDMDGGVDRIKSAVSYKLQNQFVENLTLVGKKDAKAIGNNADNHIKGNSGDNVLAGKAGADVLDGGAGNDKLIGGAGADTFRFATGHGKDVISDFENGDGIDLTGWKAIGNFSQVRKHAENHGADVWIVAGADTLVIDHLHKADLHAGDFHF